MHLFRFSVDSLGWPMMEYKVSPIDPVWSLLDAPPIRLWKTNPNGPPKFPTKIPSHVPYNLIWGMMCKGQWREKFISAQFSK